MLSALGPASLFFSNVAAIMVLMALRSLSHSPAESVCLLTIGNLLCASLLFFPRITGHAAAPWTKKTLFSLAIWTLCYTISYGIYTLFPNAMSLSDLIIAESLAPTAAVVISGDWRFETARYQRLLANLGAVALLLIIAILKRDSSSNPTEASGSALLVIITMLCFLGSNVGARNISKLGPPLWAQARVSSLNGILLTVFIFSTQRWAAIEHFRAVAAPGLLLAFGILISQGTFIFGLARTSPFLSALLISTTVPISLLTEAVANGRSLIAPEGALGILYCILIWLTQRWFARTTSAVTFQPSS